MRAVRRRAHGHRALHVGMWNAIVVEIEARVGRLANVHGNDVISVERVVGQREKLQLLVLKGLSNAELAIGRANAVASLVVAPQRCLRVEIGKIGECACGKDAVTHVANGTLDAALLIAARRCDGARFVAVMSGELQQGRIKLNGVALSPQDGAFEILCVVTGYVQLWHLVVVRDCPCRSEREVIASGLLGPRVQIPAGRRDRGLPQGVAHGRQIGPPAQGVGSMRVAQEVRRNLDLADAGQPGGALDPLPRGHQSAPARAGSAVSLFAASYWHRRRTHVSITLVTDRRDADSNRSVIT